MAYKMKGNPFTKGTIQGTRGHSAAVERLKLNRSGYENRPDGREKSSAFQLTDEEKEIATKTKTSSSSSSKSKPVVTVTENPDLITINKSTDDTGSTRTDTITKSSGNTNTVENNFKAKRSNESAVEIWKGKNPGGTRAEYEKSAQEYRDSKKTSKDKPHSSEKTKTECTCTSKQTYVGVKAGQQVKHKCGSPHPACSEKETTILKEPRQCSCTPKGSDKPIVFDCGTAKPAACESKGSTKDCPDSKRENCGKNRMWSSKKCRCVRRKNDQGKARIKGTVRRKNLVTGGFNTIQGKGFSE